MAKGSKDLKGLSEERIFALKNEIIMSEELNKEELQPMMCEALQRYTGEFFPRFGTGWDILLNEIYPVVQNYLPSIFFRNPRAFLKAVTRTFIFKKRDPLTGKMVEVQEDSSKSASTQTHILNFIIKNINYKDETRKVLLDALLFPHGVMWHGYKGNFGMTDEDSFFVKDEQIFVQRIDPMRFHKDPSVTFNELDKAMWVARSIDMRMEDLINDKDLNVSKSLKGFRGFGEKVGTQTSIDRANINPLKNGQDTTVIFKSKNLIDCTDEEFKKSSLSQFIRVHEVYLRPNKKEKNEGKKGWIVLLTPEQKEPLRVNEWTVKAKGFPAHLLTFNPVPSRMFSMPDIDVYKSIADQKNIISNLQIRNAQENTKVWVGISSSGTEEQMQKIQQGENTIIIFDGDVKPSERMFVASPGAQASSELYLIDQRIQRNLEDKSGITDLKRGFLQSGEESATSVKIRAAGSSGRILYRQDLMKDFISKSFNYINQLNKQYMTVNDAVRVMGTLDIVWSNDFTKEEIQAPTDVEIDAISMLPDNPQEELQSLDNVMNLMIQALVTPPILDKINQEGNTFNISPVIEQVLMLRRINNPEVFRSIKEEESQGFVSVVELRAAESNVQAALTNSEIPSPPAEGQDHSARLEVYGSIKRLLDQAGQISEVLDQLIQAQSQLLQQVQEKQATPGQQIKLSKGGVQSV